MDPITLTTSSHSWPSTATCAPGLAVGVRAARIGLREVGRLPHQPVSVVAETAMCSVEAVQFLTGSATVISCSGTTGKNAFTFVRRSDGRAVRVMARPDALPPIPSTPGCGGWSRRARPPTPSGPGSPSCTRPARR